MFVSRSAGGPTAHCWLLASDCQLNADCNACLACEMLSIRCVMFCFLVGQRTGVSAAGKPAGCGWPQAGWQCVAKIEYLIRGYVGQNGCIALTYCSVGWADFGILYCTWETSLVKSELFQFMHSQRCNNGVASFCGRDVRGCQKGFVPAIWRCQVWAWATGITSCVLLCRLQPDIHGNRFWTCVGLSATILIE